MRDRSAPDNRAYPSAVAPRARAVIEAEPFADEVAIDFPSVPALMSRVWEAFADEERAREPLPVIIELTPSQARRGMLLPISVPLRGVCPACGGRGELWLEGCRRCGGSGECRASHRVTITVPPRVRDGAGFRFRLISAFAPPTPVVVLVVVRRRRPATS